MGAAPKSKGKDQRKGALGRALLKKPAKIINQDGVLKNYYGVEEERADVNSFLESSEIDDYLQKVTLENREFTTQRTKLRLGNYDESAEKSSTEEDENSAPTTLQGMPIRPQWNREMTKEELQKLENEAFLSWRRHNSAFEHLSLTPYEKNINIWRELWRVVEKSELVVQIVDGRNINFYRNDDLEDYVRKLGRKNMLVINKSDMVTESQRKTWAKYLNSKGIAHCFFSAFAEDYEKSENVPVPTIENTAGRVLSPSELHQYLTNECPSREDGAKPTIGFVGYPNVGKSSTINSLLANPKLRVSKTPGKTKHLQTIHLEGFVLCDCPGLVFPRIVGYEEDGVGMSNGGAECVLNGVYPIDQLRNPLPPAELLCSRLPRGFLAKHYNIKIPAKYNPLNPRPSSDTDPRPTLEICSGEGLLRAFARGRGMTRGSLGMPDESGAARVILRDFVQGTSGLVYVMPPPGCDPLEFNSHLYGLAEPDEINDDFDNQFFAGSEAAPSTVRREKDAIVVKTKNDIDFKRAVFGHQKQAPVMGDKKHKKQSRKKKRTNWTAED